MRVVRTQAVAVSLPQHNVDGDAVVVLHLDNALKLDGLGLGLVGGGEEEHGGVE